MELETAASFIDIVLRSFWGCFGPQNGWFSPDLAGHLSIRCRFCAPDVNSCGVCTQKRDNDPVVVAVALSAGGARMGARVCPPSPLAPLALPALLPLEPVVEDLGSMGVRPWVASSNNVGLRVRFS